VHIDHLARAIELQAELRQWRDAEQRCNPTVFKEAMLRVVDMAHGHQGQVADTQIKLKSEYLLPFVKTQIGRVIAELRDIGVEI
jgi:hypothetical protein